MDPRRAEPTGHRDAAFGLARTGGRTLMVLNPRVSAGARRAWWDLPGGALRPGESLPEGLGREWREETGLTADVGDLLFVLDGAKRRPDGALLYTWRAFFFAVTSAGVPTAGEGIDEVAWVPDDDVAGRLEAPYHEALRRFLAGDTRRHAQVRWVEPLAARAIDAEVPRRLLVVAAAAAVGDTALLRREVTAARDAGVPSKRLRETLLQVVPYAGYPRSITAFGAVKPLLAPADEDEDPSVDRAARGRAVFEQVYGDRAAAVAAGLEALDPVLARWTLEHAYGRVLSREGVLTLLERELIAVSVLTALGGLQDPLLGHMRACLRLGADVDHVRAAVDVVPASIGEGRRNAARRLLARL